MNRQQPRTIWLPILLAVAFGLRMGAVVLAPEQHLSTNAEIAYLGGAHLLVEGKGFGDPSYPLFTPPLYAGIIAILIHLVGEDQLSIKVVQALADSFTVIVIYFLAREIFDSETALISAAIWAIYPFSIYATLYVGPEAIFTLFLGLTLLLMVYAIKYQSWRHYSGAGILLGLATLIRGTTQFIPLLFPFMLLYFKRGTKRSIMNYGIFLLSFIIIVAPWSLRNYLVLNDFIPVAAAGGVFLYGSSEKFLIIKDRERHLPELLEELRVKKHLFEPPKGSKPSEHDQYLLQAGIEIYKNTFKDDHLGFVTFMFKKFLRLWYGTESGNNQGYILGVNSLIYLLALVGILISWLQRKQLAVLLIFVLVYFIVLHTVSFPMFRYMLPVMPYVIAFAAFSIAISWGAMLRGRFGSASRGLWSAGEGSGGL